MFDIHKICGAAYVLKIVGDSLVFEDANETWLTLAGVTGVFRPGVKPASLFPSTVAIEVERHSRKCLALGQAIAFAETSPSSGFASRRTTLFPLTDERGMVASIIGICCSVSCEDTDGLSPNDKASMAIDAIDGGYWIYEVGDQAFEASRSLTEMLAGPGHAPLNLAEYISFVHSADLGTAGLHDTEQDRSEAEYRVVTFDGRTLWLRSQRRTVRDANRRPIRIVGHVADITQQKLAFDALRAEASTDALTSIKNRRAFDRLAAEAFRRSRGDGKPVGVLLVDLDGFKPINDRYGHRTGDEVLRKVARRIGRFVRKSDCFARVGGDEFAILLRGTSAVMGEPLATRIRHAFRKPFMVGVDSIFVGISIGIGVSATRDQKIADVVDRADRALYVAKQTRQLQSA